MSTTSLSLIDLARRMLNGGTVAKAEGTEDPDAIQQPDERTEGGAPTEENLAQAREEAQSAPQQEEGAPDGEGEGAGEGGEGGEGGAGGSTTEPDGDEGTPGPGDGDADELSKAQVLKSIRFLAETRGITAAEITKSFTGLEGDPSKGEAPMGKGVEFLEKLVEGQESQNKVLDAISGFLAELAKNQTHLSQEIGKSLEAASAAMTTAEAARNTIAQAMRQAPALDARALVQRSSEVAKAEAPQISSQDLFKLALEGKMSPTEVAAANRGINYRA